MKQNAIKTAVGVCAWRKVVVIVLQQVRAGAN